MSIQEALDLGTDGFTLIRDSMEAPGSFLLLQMLRSALKQDHKVVSNANLNLTYQICFCMA